MKTTKRILFLAVILFFIVSAVYKLSSNKEKIRETTALASQTIAEVPVKISAPKTGIIKHHTFATTITLTKGVPIETVSKMLGHTSIKTTQIYARITDNKIGNDMQALSEKLQGMDKILSL